MDDRESLDPAEYIQQKEEYEEKRDDFMCKHLRRAWPIRIVRILGVFQLLICLAMLGVDLPIILMFAPRWQVFAGCWGFVLGFVACVSTFHSTRKMTWPKLKWAVGFNILGGLAAAVMIAFNILYLVNPYMCIVIGGCSYLSYTYSAVKSYYTGEVVLGIMFLITAFVFIILFIKYGIGGTALFEDIQNGWVPNDFRSIVPPNGTVPVQQNPTTGPGVMNKPPPTPEQMMGPRYPLGPAGMMPRYPVGPGGMMPRYPAGPGGMMPRYPVGPGGMMPRYPVGPGGMVPGPHGPMMMPGPHGPMMMPGPHGPMMMPGPHGPMMMPGPRGQMVMPYPRGPMPGYYPQQGPMPGYNPQQGPNPAHYQT